MMTDDGEAGYLVELPQQDGSSQWVCSDTDWCNRQLNTYLPEDQDFKAGELW